jgi:hypothetical protein
VFFWYIWLPWLHLASIGIHFRTVMPSPKGFIITRIQCACASKRTLNSKTADFRSLCVLLNGVTCFWTTAVEWLRQWGGKWPRQNTKSRCSVQNT